jgi:hypothetical protein
LGNVIGTNPSTAVTLTSLILLGLSVMPVWCIHVKEFAPGIMFNPVSIVRVSEFIGLDNAAVSVARFVSLLISVAFLAGISSSRASVLKRFVVECTRSSPGRFRLISVKCVQ